MVNVSREVAIFVMEGDRTPWEMRKHAIRLAVGNGPPFEIRDIRLLMEYLVAASQCKAGELMSMMAMEMLGVVVVGVAFAKWKSLCLDTMLGPRMMGGIQRAAAPQPLTVSNMGPTEMVVIVAMGWNVGQSIINEMKTDQSASTAAKSGLEATSRGHIIP